MFKYYRALTFLKKKKRQNIQVTADDIFYLREIGYSASNRRVIFTILLDVIFLAFFTPVFFFLKIKETFASLCLLILALILLVEIICMVINKRRYNTLFNLKDFNDRFSLIEEILLDDR